MSAATAPLATRHELRHNLKENPPHNLFFSLSFSGSHHLHNLSAQPQYAPSLHSFH